VISRASQTVGATGKAGFVFASVMIPAGVYLLIAGTRRLARISSCCPVVGFRTATVIVGSYVSWSGRPGMFRRTGLAKEPSPCIQFVVSTVAGGGVGDQETKSL
jgi:hypothetical protein